MNIAILTTWNSACGIAEYSRNIVEELRKEKHNVLVLNNIVDGESIKSGSAFVEAKVFGVQWWNQNPSFEVQKALDMMNYFENAVGPLDGIFVQYQSSLYEPKGFNEFLQGIKCKKVLVQHDSSINKKHNLQDFNNRIVHNIDMTKKFSRAEGDVYIPFPTIELQPTVFSFGMGDRNDYEFIKKACEELDIAFEKHDARKDGWIREDILFQKMNDADAIVLWYNEVGIEGQSSALRTAISSMRPVIVNDVGWFKDAPNFVHKVRTDTISHKAQLQATLIDVLHLVYIRENSYTECAKKYLSVL
jgi:hypothetical protein